MSREIPIRFFLCACWTAALDGGGVPWYHFGRMGVPYHARGVNIISVAVDAPADAISALSGKIGRLAGITAKTVYAPEDALQQGK